MAILFIVGVASILYQFVVNLVSVMNANVVIGSYDDEVKNLDTSEIDELFARLMSITKAFIVARKPI